MPRLRKIPQTCVRAYVNPHDPHSLDVVPKCAPDRVFKKLPKGATVRPYQGAAYMMLVEAKGKPVGFVDVTVATGHDSVRDWLKAKK